MSIYDDYVWRIRDIDAVFDLQLPKDIKWVDELTWSAVKQDVQYSLTGAAIVTESLQQTGRPITLQGMSNMGWVKRSLINTLVTMRDIPNLLIHLQFVKYVDSAYTSDVLIDFFVTFRHIEQPVIDFESAKGFDDFDPDTDFIVKSIKFMEVSETFVDPCTPVI